MSIANHQWIKGTQLAGVGLLCSLAIVGCNRSEKVDEEADKVVIVKEETVAPVIACDNPLVQDKLKAALKNTVNQQAQSVAASYANAAGISLDANAVTSKINGMLIDVQNAALLQDANANGMTTCQASVSMTLASEDLYQANQLQSANNQPSLQTRLAQNNIRINNNMLVDDAFSYVVGTQGGQVQARIIGQPTLVTVVSEVIAGSAVSTLVSERRAVQQQTEQAERRAATAQNNAAQAQRQQLQEVIPLEPTRPAQPVRPAQPASPPTITQGGGVQSSTQAAPVTTPKSTPKDDSIDMVIIEDESATY